MGPVVAKKKKRKKIRLSQLGFLHLKYAIRVAERTLRRFCKSFMCVCACVCVGPLCVDVHACVYKIVRLYERVI